MCHAQLIKGFCEPRAAFDTEVPEENCPPVGSQGMLSPNEELDWEVNIETQRVGSFTLELKIFKV